MKKLITKYNNTSKIFKGSLWFSFSTFLQFGLTIIATPIFTRIFSLEQYGIYSLYSTWLSILLIVSTFNISGPIFNTIIHKYSETKQSILSNSIYSQLLIYTISLVVFIFYSCFCGELYGISLTLGIIIYIQILLNIPYRTWIAKCKYENDYLKCCILVIIQAILSFGFSIGFVFLFSNLILGRIIGFILPLTIFSFIAIYYIFRKTKLLDNKINWRMIKSILIITFPLLFHYLAQSILSQSDRLFIHYYYGDDEVAIYSLIYSLSLLLTVVITAVNSTLTPWRYKQFDTRNMNKNRKITSIFVTEMSLMVFCLVLIGPEIIYFFGGEKYSPGVSLIPILANTILILLVYDTYSSIEFYLGKTIYAAIFTVAGALVNIGMNFLLIPIYGITGAAFATIISYLVMAILHIICSKILMKKRLNNISCFNDKYILFTILISILLNFSIYFIYDYFIARIILFMITIIIGILVFIKNKHFLSH